MTRTIIRVIIYDVRGNIMKSYSSRELIKILESDGWEIVRVTGSHHIFRHAVKKGTVTVPHPRKDFPINTVKSILLQAGLTI